MTVSVSPPDWSVFIDDLLPAAEHLEDYDAHCSLEAATLLQAAHDTLLALNGVRAWDHIVQAIGRLAELGFRHVDKLPRAGEWVGNKLPPHTIAFICAVHHAYALWGSYRDREDVIEELCRATAGKEA